MCSYPFSYHRVAVVAPDVLLAPRSAAGATRGAGRRLVAVAHARRVDVWALPRVSAAGAGGGAAAASASAGGASSSSSSSLAAAAVGAPDGAQLALTLAGASGGGGGGGGGGGVEPMLTLQVRMHTAMTRTLCEEIV